MFGSKTTPTTWSWPNKGDANEKQTDAQPFLMTATPTALTQQNMVFDNPPCDFPHSRKQEMVHVCGLNTQEEQALHTHLAHVRLPSCAFSPYYFNAPPMI